MAIRRVATMEDSATYAYQHSDDNGQTFRMVGYVSGKSAWDIIAKRCAKGDIPGSDFLFTWVEG